VGFLILPIHAYNPPGESSPRTHRQGHSRPWGRRDHASSSTITEPPNPSTRQLSSFYLSASIQSKQSILVDTDVHAILGVLVDWLLNRITPKLSISDDVRFARFAW